MDLASYKKDYSPGLTYHYASMYVDSLSYETFSLVASFLTV